MILSTGLEVEATASPELFLHFLHSLLKVLKDKQVIVELCSDTEDIVNRRKTEKENGEQKELYSLPFKFKVYLLWNKCV